MTPYEQAMLNMQERQAQGAWQKEQASPTNMNGVADESGPIGEGVAKTDWLGNSNLTQNLPAQQDQVAGATEASAGSSATAGAGAALNQPAGSSAATKLGAGMTAAGAASVNPYLAAAGLAVSAYGKISDGKRQSAQNKYLAEVQKYNARQTSIEKLANIGAGLKA